MPEHEKRVLVVEDNKLTAKVITISLKRRDSGILVFHTGTLDEARQVIDDEILDVVSTDGDLGPGGLMQDGIGDGIEVARIMRAKDPAVPVVLYSGYNAKQEELVHFRYTFLKGTDPENFNNYLGTVIALANTPKD